MNPSDLRAFLGASRDALNTLHFLTTEYFPAVIALLNEPNTRRRIALYGGDRIPENERNLTDVRTRMSLLIESNLAWVGNDVLESHEITDLFWSNVVANRFPDLEIRSNSGKRGLRIEVKCIEAIAEEKAANFDTLKKDLTPWTDYLAVFIWEWFRDVASVGWDRAPKILRAFVFHAAALAELRDYKWLQNPPKNLGGGYQGFDIRYALNCRNGIYSVEEGNFGKLLRIWDKSTTYAPDSDDLLRSTAATYLEFQEFSIWSGFEVLAKDLLRQRGATDPKPIECNENVVGFREGEFAFLLKRRVGTMADQLAFAKSQDIRRFVVMTDKYQWTDYKLTSDELQVIQRGDKPKKLLIHLSETLALSDTT